MLFYCIPVLFQHSATYFSCKLNNFPTWPFSTLLHNSNGYNSLYGILDLLWGILTCSWRWLLNRKSYWWLLAFLQVVITKCYHLFCGPCIQRNLEIRHRKCPACGVPFGQSDVRNVYIWKDGIFRLTSLFFLYFLFFFKNFFCCEAGYPLHNRSVYLVSLRCIWNSTLNLMLSIWDCLKGRSWCPFLESCKVLG